MSKPLSIYEVEEYIPEDDEPDIACGEYDKYTNSDDFFPCNEDQYCNTEEKKCVNKSITTTDPSLKRFVLDKNKPQVFLGKASSLKGLNEKYKKIKIEEFDRSDKARLQQIREAEALREAEEAAAANALQEAEAKREAKKEDEILKIFTVEQIEQIIRSVLPSIFNSVDTATTKPSEYKKMIVDATELSIEDIENNKRLFKEILEDEFEKYEIRVAEKERILKQRERMEKEVLEAEKAELKKLKEIKEEVKTGKVEKEIKKTKEVKEILEKKEKEEKSNYLNKTLTRTQLVGAVFHLIYKKYLTSDIKSKDLYNQLYKKFNIGETIKDEPKTEEIIDGLIKKFKSVDRETQISMLAQYPEVETEIDIKLDLKSGDIKEIEKKIMLPISKEEVEVRVKGEDKLFSRYKILRIIKELELSCDVEDMKRYSKEDLLNINYEFDLGIKEEDTKPKKSLSKKVDLCNEVLKRLKKFYKNLPEAKIDPQQEQKDNERFNEMYDFLKSISSKLKACDRSITVDQMRKLVKDYNLETVVSNSKGEKKEDICKKVNAAVKEQYRLLREVLSEILEKKQEAIYREAEGRPIVLAVEREEEKLTLAEEQEREREAQAQREREEQEREREAQAQREREEQEREREAQAQREREEQEREREAQAQREREAQAQREREEQEREREAQAQREREEQEQEREREAQAQREREERELIEEKEREIRRETPAQRRQRLELRQVKDVIDRTIHDLKEMRREGRMEYELYKLPKTVAICTGLSV